MKPTIYLTNFASRKPPHRGPGAVYSIMAKPRRWEHGDGTVHGLVPATSDLDAARSGAIDVAEYRRRYIAGAPAPKWLVPGSLEIGPGFPAADGDTLCCACSRDAAARGECHRVWAADLLVAAGWRVVLDGVEVAVPTVTIPGDIPKLFRRCSPFVWRGGETGVVCCLTRDGGALLAVDGAVVERDLAACGAALDLSDPTGQQHAAAWVEVMVGEVDVDWWTVEDGAFGDLDRAGQERLRDIVLRLAGRSA